MTKIRSPKLLAGLAGLLTCIASGATVAAGFSGMAKIDEHSYLVVRDLKAPQDGDRMAVIHTAMDSSPVVVPVQVAGWDQIGARGSDLEGVCQVPGRKNEYLLIESGHWNGNIGRLFYVSLDVTTRPHTAAVKHVFNLEVFDPKKEGEAGDEFEGLACAAMDDGRTLVILGERGGSEPYPDGLLRWFVADLDNKVLTWPDAGKRGKTVQAPGEWRNPDEVRNISSLYLDSSNSLWAGAAEDAGDNGPMKSVIYRIGTVHPNSHNPIEMAECREVARQVDGFKIEGLAGPGAGAMPHQFTIATDDELYEGVWRPIP